MEEFKSSGNFNRDRLDEAVQSAQLLLSHASEKGMDVEKEIITTLVQSKHLHETGSWNPETETEFWLAFNAMTRAVKPVTIAGIRASMPMPVRPTFWHKIFHIKAGLHTSLARKAVRKYTWWGLFWVVVMLIIQVYSLIGSTLVDNIHETEAKFNQLVEEQNVLAQVDSDSKKAIIDQQKLGEEINARAVEIVSTTELLVQWQKPVYELALVDTSFYNLSALQETSDDLFAPAISREKIDTLKRVEQVAKYPILIMQRYILPLLYGLLGAYAFVLRKLTEETRHLTYTLESDIKYFLRVVLGAIAGLIIGFFFVSNDTPAGLSMASLSPLTLAFLGGYSVEFLFTVIDRAISTLTQQTENKKDTND